MTIKAEEIISQEQRVDLLLVWNEGRRPPPKDRVFRRLWAVLPRLTVLEYKSPSRSPRIGVFDQLFAYGHILARKERSTLVSPREHLALVLATATITPTLNEEAALYGLEITSQGGGLYELQGALISTWLVALNETSIDVGRPLIGAFGSRDPATLGKEGGCWLAERFMSNAENLKDLSDSEELEERFMKSPVFTELMRKHMQDPERLRELLTDLPLEQLPEDLKAELLRRAKTTTAGRTSHHEV